MPAYYSSKNSAKRSIQIKKNSLQKVQINSDELQTLLSIKPDTSFTTIILSCLVHDQHKITAAADKVLVGKRFGV